MTIYDWVLVAVPLAIVLFIGWRTQRYMQGVSDFMSAGRVAGRYLISVSAGEAALGLISVVALFEMYGKSGFAVSFWGMLSAPVGLILGLTGFVIYRFRQTRALTLAQFFEVRYSRKFRFFAGTLCAVSGILNYAVFPAVGGRFLMYYCQIPTTTPLGPVSIPTFPLIMVIALFLAVMLAIWGGQLTIMVTDCVQGLFSYWIYIVIVIVVLMTFKWSQISQALLERPAGESMLDPFDISKLSDFNIWYVLIGLFGSVYGRMSWQGNQGFNCSAASPHEQKMGGILGTWRSGFSALMIVLLGVAAFTYMHHPDFAAGAAKVNAELAAIPSATIQTQMTASLAVRQFLPIGVTGLFVALMIFLMVSTDASYLHSWGSIVIQDIIIPICGDKPLSPQLHMLILRLGIIGVALFAFFFSWFWSQTTFILMFFALTGAIYLGGAGACILGGLYWKKGTAAGAWCAMSIGSFLAVMSVALGQPVIWKWVVALYPALLPGSAWIQSNPERFPINGQWTWFIAMLAATSSYFIVSLLTCREDFNMDRMLHRGAYAKEEPRAVALVRKPWWQRILGIDEQFTRGDKILSWSVFIYTLLMFGIFAGVVLLNLILRMKTGHTWSGQAWATYFFWMQLVLPMAIGAVTSVWFTIGGTRDLLRLFKSLKTLQRNEQDDGRVLGHTNAEDLALQSIAPEGDLVIDKTQLPEIGDLPDVTPVDR